jgi:hypothetical protein
MAMKWRQAMIGMETYAPGHILVGMNNGMLCNASSGSDGPKTFIKCNATSSDIYSVATKKATVKK